VELEGVAESEAAVAWWRLGIRGVDVSEPGLLIGVWDW